MLNDIHRHTLAVFASLDLSSIHPAAEIVRAKCVKALQDQARPASVLIDITILQECGEFLSGGYAFSEASAEVLLSYLAWQAQGYPAQDLRIENRFREAFNTLFIEAAYFLDDDPTEGKVKLAALMSKHL